MLLFLEQLLNGLQLGVMLFLLAAGLTLVFGIMGLINLAHGSLYMVGAYACAATLAVTGSFFLGLLAALAAAAATGLAVETIVLRRLYARGHLDQVLATFGLILFFNEAVNIIWGPRPLFIDVPAALSGTVEVVPGAPYPLYRLAIIVVGITVATALWWLVQRTRLGMLIRAGAADRDMLSALGIDTRRLYSSVFVLGALLAGLAGALAGPLFAVQIGMGKNLKEVLNEMVQVAEGFRTAESVIDLSKKYGVDMPISQEVYNVLFQEKEPKKAVFDLMNRDPKVEDWY